MNSKKLNFAVIGCGNIGKRHIAVLDAEPKANLSIICDIDENICRQLSGKYNNLPWETNYKNILENPDIDFVSICTPHHLHADMTINSCRAKKNVLVEKPMALNAEDCRRMIEAANTNNVKLQVVKQNRFNIPIVMAKEALDSGKLGKIYMVKCDVLWNRYEGYYTESDWRGKIELEGGALFTQASHFIDLLVWWFGDIVDAKTLIETKAHKIEIEDTGVSIVHFNSGVTGSLNWTTNVYNKNYEGSITIIGEYGTIKIGGQYLNKIEFWDVRAWPLPENVDFSDKPNSYGKYQGTSSNHHRVIENLINSFLSGEGKIVDGNEGKKSIDAIEKIYNAAK